MLALVEKTKKEAKRNLFFKVKHFKTFVGSSEVGFRNEGMIFGWPRVEGKREGLWNNCGICLFLVVV